jgi:hypothetical protein
VEGRRRWYDCSEGKRGQNEGGRGPRALLLLLITRGSEASASGLHLNCEKKKGEEKRVGSEFEGCEDVEEGEILKRGFGR